MTGGKVITGSGTLTLADHVTVVATNATAVIEGNVILPANRDFTVNDGSPSVDMFVPASISGAFELDKKNAGTLVLGGVNTFSGGMKLSAGILGVSNNAAMGTGLLTLDGGSIRAETAARTVTNAISLGANPIFLGSQDLIFAGDALLGSDRTFLVSNTAITKFSGALSGGSKITISGPGTLTFSGANSHDETYVYGILNIQNNSALGTAVRGSFVYSGGTLQLQENIAIGTEALSLNGSGVGNAGALRNISGNNSWAGRITLAAASTIASDSGTLTLISNVVNGGFVSTFSGAGNIAVNNVISGTGGLTKSGTGMVTLSGSNTFTGIVSINAGTLSLGSSERIANAANMSLGGGNFDTAGQNETVGTLTLAAKSTIDLGAGASVLRFGASSAASWTAGATLTISNWSGSVLGGGTDQIFIGSNTNGLTASQLGKVRFFNGSEMEAAVFLSTGEIVPGGRAADLVTTKTGATNVVAGGNLTYTLTVLNSGPTFASNIVVSDVLPARSTFISASTGGSHAGGTVTWTAFNLGADDSTNLTVTVTAPGSGSLTNTVSSLSTTYDPEASNNNGSAVDAKVITDVTAQGNGGNDNSSCITATNVSTRTWSHTVNSGNNRILIVGLALRDRARTVSSITYGGTALTKITSSAVRNGVELWRLVAPAVGSANIVATWSGSSDVVGWSGTFTNIDQTNPIGNTAVNNGSSTGPNVTLSASIGDIVVDTLSTTGDAGTLTAAGGQTQICNGLTGTGSSAGRGASSYASGAGSVTMSWTQSSKAWEIAAVVLKAAAPTQADVTTAKTGATSVYAASNLTYTITVTNHGPATASNVVVLDTLPAGAAFISASSGGTSNNGAVTWPTMVNFPYGSSTNFTLTIRALTSGTMTNTVSSTATTSDPVASNNNGTDAGATVLTDITPVASVQTTKSGATTVSATSNFTYTISVTNFGPNTATNLIVTDLLPTNVTFVSASSEGTNDLDLGTVVWPTLPTLDAGAFTNFTITVTAPLSGVLTNTVSSTADTLDLVPSDNDGSNGKVVTTVLQSADVKTTKSGATTVFATSNLTYTITVTNLGPNSATNVIVSDPFPTNATFVSASSGGTNSNGTVIWPTMTNFVAGFTTNFTVTVAAPASGSLTNIALSTATSIDPNAANNDGTADNARVVTAVRAIADVMATKTGPATVAATSNLTYTITVTNLGPGAATNVVAGDLLPTNVTFVSASGGGAYADGEVTWPAIATLNVGATTNFTVTVTAPAAGVLTNIASSTATTIDPNLSNNDGTSTNAFVATTVLQMADVMTTKIGPASVYGTSNLTYTITVTNLGPNDATNVIVSDLLPTNVTFVSASSGGTNGSGVVTWPTMSNCAVGFTTNFTVTVTAPTGGSFTNAVSSSATTTDPDGSNNNGSASNAKVITSVTPVSDLKVTKTGAASVVAGSNLTYTITVTNLGPNNATNVLVTDTLPTNTTFVSASGGGSYSAGVVTWPALTNVTTTNFTVTITAPGSGSLTNSANCTSTTFDPDASNNDGSASNARVITTVTPSADVVTTKIGPTSATGNSNITYTITVTNHGPSAASNVVVVDTLPVGVTFVSASSGGTTNNGMVTWPTLTNFANAAFTNFTVVVTLPGSGSVTNAVSSTSDTGDPDASNNNGSSASAKVITTVVAVLADVATSVSGPLSAAASTNITYTIVVTNMGPGTASNVVVLDTLPAGVTFVSASGGGLESGGVVTWPTLTNFANAAATNFTVTVTVPDSGTLTNTVSSTSDTSDPDASNNNGSSASGQVITLILGVNVTGYAYLDANKNGFKDGVEAGTGLGLFAKIYATTNVSGPALQTAAVDGTSGAFTLTNIYRGTYTVILDNNNLLSDVTPTLPGGWTGTEMPAQVRTPVAVARADLPNQNFGLIHSVGIAGKVFKDTGAGGGTANDGISNGTETGLGGVTVKLTDSTGATTYDTATTDGGGNYTLLLPSSLTNGAALKVVETNPSGHLSTGAGVGNTGGAADRASDTIPVTLTAGAAYTGVNFGDVPENSFIGDSQQAGLPGSFVVHPHTFTAGSGGQVAFSLAAVSTPGVSNWSRVIYRDANCNGVLDAGEAVITAALTVTAGEKVCIVIKDFIPPAAPFNAQDQITVTATFTYTDASPALNGTATRTALTTVGHPTTTGLTLVKSVDKATALPGETISYTVTYANNSSDTLNNIVIYDETPAFTTFVSAGNGTLPANLSGVVTTAPGVGSAGPIRWTFTGTLAPGHSGTVTFTVTVTP